MAADEKSLCCPIKFLGGGGNSKMVPLRLVRRRELPGCPPLPPPPLKAISTPIVNLEKIQKGEKWEIQVWDGCCRQRKKKQRGENSGSRRIYVLWGSMHNGLRAPPPPPNRRKTLLICPFVAGEGFGFWASDFAGLRYMPTYKTNAFSGPHNNNPNNAFPQKNQQKGLSFAKCYAFSGIFLSGRSAPFLIREFATCVARLQKKVKKNHPIFLPRSPAGLGPYKKMGLCSCSLRTNQKIPSFFFFFAVGVPLKKPPGRKVFSSKIPLPSPELIKKERRANQHRCCCLGDSKTGAELLCSHPFLEDKSKKRDALKKQRIHTRAPNFSKKHLPMYVRKYFPLIWNELIHWRIAEICPRAKYRRWKREPRYLGATLLIKEQGGAINLRFLFAR